MDATTVLFVVVALFVLLVVVSVVKAVQQIPQAQAAVIERLGRYQKTQGPGLVLLVPFIDRVRARIDLREQVESFPPQSVITQDNLTVNIDTVVYYVVLDPKAAVYEISDYIMGVEQITITTLRNVVGGMTFEETLTSRDEINDKLRGELDMATGDWGIRVRRVEIKAIEPPPSIQEAMERQMKADREKRAVILTAEGQRESAIRSAEGQKQSQILTAEGAKQAAILAAEGERQSRILRAQGERAAQYLQAQGEAKAIEKVFAAIKAGRPTPELLAYQYLQTLPEMAKGEANKVWMVPSDFGKALEGFTRMLGAPGEDGVFRFTPSPDDGPTSRPEDDEDAVRDWFDTSPDPALAQAVAEAEQQARQAVPPPGVPEIPERALPGPADAALDPAPPGRSAAPTLPVAAPRYRLTPPAPAPGLPVGSSAGRPPEQGRPDHHRREPAGPEHTRAEYAGPEPTRFEHTRFDDDRTEYAGTVPRRPSATGPSATVAVGPLDPTPESALPTPPRGMPQVPAARADERAAGAGGNGSSGDAGARGVPDGPDAPTRPGYPSPSPRD